MEICSEKLDFERFREQYPKVPAVMFGRGVLANPELIGEIKGQKCHGQDEVSCIP